MRYLVSLLAGVALLGSPALAQPESGTSGEQLDTEAPTSQTIEQAERTAERALQPADYYESTIQNLELFELGKAVQTGLAENPQIRLQELTREERRLELESFKYQFRPSFTLNSELSHNERGGAASVQFNFGISASDQWNNYFQISKPTRDGGTLTLRQEFGKTKIGATGGGDNPSAGVPTFEGVTSLTWQRPLFRGSGDYINKIDKLISSNQLELADTVHRLTRMDVVQQVVNQYLELVQLQEAVRVREASLESAQELLRRNIERYRVGLSLQSDVLEAENSVLAQRSALQDAITAYRTGKREFLNLLGIDRDIAFRVEPDVRERLESPEGNTSSLISKAYRYDQQLSELKTQMENSELEEDRLEDQLEPDIDLTASVQRQGEDFHELGAFEEERFTSYSVGLQWNFGGTEAATKNQLERNRKQRERLEEQITDRRRQLGNRVQALQDEIEGLKSSLEAARTNVEAAQERLELTRARVQSGLATTVDQVRAEEELLSARLERLQAQIQLNQRRKELARLTGEVYGDLLAGPGTEEQPEPDEQDSGGDDSGSAGGNSSGDDSR